MKGQVVPPARQQPERGRTRIETYLSYLGDTGTIFHGLLFCGRCGHVLVFSRVRGKTGAQYEYYGCLSRQGQRARVCRASHIRVEKVEPAVADFYASVRLSASEQEDVRTAMRAYSEHKALTAQRESDRDRRRLVALQREQQKLLQAVYRGSVDEEVLASEQQRIDTERQAAQRSAAAATQDVAELQEALEEALRLLRDPQLRYRQADAASRRRINQALFEKRVIRNDEVAEVKPSPWVIELHRAAPSRSRAPAGSQIAGRAAETPTTPFRGPRY